MRKLKYDTFIVEIAKDVNSSEIPSKMYKEGNEIYEEEISESFAEFFEEKILGLLTNIVIDPRVYNGRI